MTNPHNQSLGDAALDQLFRTARTRNAWSDRPVSDETIRAIYELAKWGPTSANCQPARFVWVKSEGARAQLSACASGSNAAKILQAPVTVIIGRDRHFYEQMPKVFPIKPIMEEMFRANPDMAQAFAVRNATLQGAYLMIAARSLGLDCGPMSGFDPAAVDATFFAGTEHEADFICSIGYGTDENLFGRLPRLEFEESNRIV